MHGASWPCTLLTCSLLVQQMLREEFGMPAPAQAHRAMADVKVSPVVACTGTLKCGALALYLQA